MYHLYDDHDILFLAKGGEERGSAAALHGLTEQIRREKRVERRGAVVLIIWGAPDAAAKSGGGPGIAATAAATQIAPRIAGHGRFAQGGRVGGVGRGGLDGRCAALLGTAAAATRLGEGSHDVFDIGLARHLRQDGGVAQHAVVQRTLRLNTQRGVLLGIKTRCCGSVSAVFLTPGSGTRDGLKKSGSGFGINNPDHISPRA